MDGYNPRSHRLEVGENSVLVRAFLGEEDIVWSQEILVRVISTKKEASNSSKKSSKNSVKNSQKNTKNSIKNSKKEASKTSKKAEENEEKPVIPVTDMSSSEPNAAILPISFAGMGIA